MSATEPQTPRLGQSDIARALHRVSDLMASGMPVGGVYVADHGVTILASELAAARWRKRCGDRIGNAPLHVQAIVPIGGAQ